MPNQFASPMYDVEDNAFLLAGPVPLHPRVQRAMAQPAHAHRSPEFTEVNRELGNLLQEVYQTEDPVLPITGSGTAAMDAAAGSLLDEGSKAVVLDNGKFGNRMAKLAKRYAGEVVHLEQAWGQPFDLDTIDQALTGAEALLFTHNETSGGFTHPIEDLVSVAEDHDVLTIADCITSLGGVDVPVGELGLDACISGSQKCIGAPAGLGFVSLSERARDELHEHPSFYIDLPQYVDRWQEHQTPWTPATHTHLATREALRILTEEGLETRFEKVRRTARATRAGAQALGLELFAHPEHRSDTLTAIELPDGVTDDEFRGGLKEMGVMVAGGQRHMSGEIFRVGHMGQVDVRDIVGFWANVEVLLRRLGHKVEHGAATRAIADELDR
jgi:aspartate aminotransferase-like enzyme